MEVKKNKLSEKEICERANQIVKVLNSFVDKEIQPDASYPELKDLFLVGCWYGAYKAIQINEREKYGNTN